MGVENEVASIVDDYIKTSKAGKSELGRIKIVQAREMSIKTDGKVVNKVLLIYVAYPSLKPTQAHLLHRKEDHPLQVDQGPQEPDQTQVQNPDLRPRRHPRGPPPPSQHQRTEDQSRQRKEAVPDLRERGVQKVPRLQS